MADENRKDLGLLQRFILWLEYVGDKMPVPAVMYAWVTVAVILISAWLAGTQFTVPGAEKPLVVFSMLSSEGIAHMLQSLFSNFSGLSIVGMMMGLSIAVGIGEHAGFYNTFITRMTGGLSEKVVIAGYIFICVNGNLISDAAVVLLPPLGAILFQARGKNPLLGILLGYFGYNGGLSANIFLASTDANVSAITLDALKLLPVTQNLSVTMMSNYFFMCLSAVALTLLGTFVAIKITEPVLDRDPEIDCSVGLENISLEIDDSQKKGLRFAGIAALITFAVVLAGVLPAGGILRAANGSLLPRSPFMSSIPQILCLFFAIVGAAYGYGARSIKSSRDIVTGATQGLKNIAPILITFFIAAQFINYLSKSNLASLFAITGANYLKDAGFTGIPLILGLLALCALVNFLIGSVSAKWAMLGPIFVPMFALLGFHPAFTQVIYRVGDAITNPINPLSTSLPLIIGYAQKYKKSAGVGTVIAHMLPYFFASLLVWGGMLVVWYLFDLPLGPGAPLLM